MSEHIYRAITEDFIRRMRNWARAGAGLLRGGGGPISSIYSMGVRVDRYVNVAPPLLLGEAEDTEVALQALPMRYRQAVQQFWRYEERPLRWHARHLRLALDPKTFEAWVRCGHELLVAQLAARAHASAVGA